MLLKPLVKLNVIEVKRRLSAALPYPIERRGSSVIDESILEDIAEYNSSLNSSYSS